MIKIENVAAEIIENCFGQEERDILEFQQGKIQMTLENQFLRHYRTACYASTKQNLFRDIAFLIEDNRILLQKIKQSKLLIDQILNPTNWDEITIRAGNSESEGSSLSTSIGKSSSDTLHKEGGVSKAQADTATIERAQAGASETSELNRLDQVIDNPKINHERLEHRDILLDETEAIWKQMTSPTQSDEPEADDVEQVLTQIEPQGIKQLEIEKSTVDPLYQNFTASINNSEDTALSYNESTAKSTDKNKTTSESSSTGVHNNKMKRGDISRKSKLADQAIQALNAEITALRSKFWHRFYPLFKYERNY